jgi:hypothetical protein
MLGWPWLKKRTGETFRRGASQLVWTPIEPHGGAAALEPHDSYFRLWLSDIFLAYDRDWFANCYPAVHASVRLRFGGHEPVTFTTLSRPPQDALGPGVFKSFQLTPLLPYKGGTIEIEAGLTALKGSSTLVAGFEVLRDFSTLIGPPLSQALDVAGKVAGGTKKLLDAADSDVLLGLHHGFTSAGSDSDSDALRPGYMALVSATDDEIDPSDLRVENGRLQVVDGNTMHPLTGRDYMLFRVEGRSERDDWRFPHVEDLIFKAKRAHFDQESKSYSNHRIAAIAEVMTSPDLTQTDQQRVARAIADELDAIVSAGLGASGDVWPDLGEIVTLRAPAAHEVRDSEPLTLEQLFAE